MISQALPAKPARLLPRIKKTAPSHFGEQGFDPRDPLQTIREYRLRKVASKRIPSRIS